MKSLKTLIVALTLAASYTTIASAQTLSPRAEANKTRVVSGVTEDLARSSALGSPRGLANKTSIAAKASHDGDTLAAIRASKLSPRAQQQLADSQFQVAPLATKELKTCDSPCCKN